MSHICICSLYRIDAHSVSASKNKEMHMTSKHSSLIFRQKFGWDALSSVLVNLPTVNKTETKKSLIEKK